MGSKLVARNLPAFDDPPIMSDTVLRNHITIAPHHPSPLMELLAALIGKWSEESNLLISASGGSPPSPLPHRRKHGSNDRNRGGYP